jgi:hypothetical protein
MKKPAEAGFKILAETVGFAYLPQAAQARARACLRLPPMMPAGASFVSARHK